MKANVKMKMILDRKERECLLETHNEKLEFCIRRDLNVQWSQKGSLPNAHFSASGES